MNDEMDLNPSEQSRRLWTPWRMKYVGGEAREVGCVFCNRLTADDDVGSLILYRSGRCFVIMNLYPYNTGHIMIVPNQHVASPEDAESETLAEMANLLPPLLRALRRVLGCHGFNIGMNVGSIAGAGVADHLHQHLVPRWNGDANFMPILGGAMIIPELIPASYAKIRAELTREFALTNDQVLSVVLVDPSTNRVLLDEEDHLPTTIVGLNEPIWKCGAHLIASMGIGATVAGWGGENRSGVRTDLVLTMIAERAVETPGYHWLDLPRIKSKPGGGGDIIRRAISQLSPLLE